MVEDNRKSHNIVLFFQVKAYSYMSVVAWEIKVLERTLNCWNPLLMLSDVSVPPGSPAI